MNNHQTNNEKFNTLINSCENPRAVYNILLQLSVEQINSIHEHAKKLLQEQYS